MSKPMTRAEAVAAFLTKVEIGHPRDCWLWTGCTYNCGYGSFNWRGKMRGANRVMWEIANSQDVPEGMDVLHSCDVRLCVNPLHLSIGTHRDNMLDMHRKGRSSWLQLKPDQVREIRERLKAPYRGLAKELCEKYGVAYGVIGKLKKGITYKFVE